MNEFYTCQISIVDNCYCPNDYTELLYLYCSEQIQLGFTFRSLEHHPMGLRSTDRFPFLLFWSLTYLLGILSTMYSFVLYVVT